MTAPSCVVRERTLYWDNTLFKLSWNNVYYEMGSNKTKLYYRTGSYLVEVPEIVRAEQHCFRDLTFFRTESEHMKNISADQLCLELKIHCFFREKHFGITAVQR